MNQNLLRHSSRRARTNDVIVEKVAHAGLWLDRYPVKVLQKGEKLKKNPQTGKEEKAPNVALIEEAIGIAVPALYNNHLKGWEAMLADIKEEAVAAEGTITVKTGIATATGPLVIGLGDESVLETSITLHHTYGVPYLPGSALKGLTAAFAHLRLKEETWRKGGAAHTDLFGDTEYAGIVNFLDAPLYIQQPSARTPLRQDVMTVHHSGYYSGTQQEGKAEIVPPTDFDSPNPVAFVSVRQGTEFRVALIGHEKWVSAAWDILSHALQEFGIGAKTSSGYGRMRLHESH